MDECDYVSNLNKVLESRGISRLLLLNGLNTDSGLMTQTRADLSKLLDGESDSGSGDGDEKKSASYSIDDKVWLLYFAHICIFGISFFFSSSSF